MGLNACYDYNSLKTNYALYSLGTSISRTYEHKEKLIRLISFVSFKMKQKDQTSTTKKVLESIFKKKLDTPENGLELYLASLSIICDDLLYDVQTFDIDKKYNNSSEIISDIKTLVNEWIPF